MTEETFNVVQFFTDDSHEYVLRRVPAQVAVQKAHSLATSVGAQIGTTKRVIVTDTGDLTNLDWINGKGLVFPLSCSNTKCEYSEVMADVPCKSCGTVTGPKVL
jgi:hypothetical protein